MKIFVTMLLLANFGSWVWVGWKEQKMVVSSPSPRSSVLTFLSAPNELQLLDGVQHTEVAAIISMEETAEQVHGKNVSVLPGAVREPAHLSLTDKVPGVWCGLSPAFPVKKEADVWLSGWTRLGGTGSVIEVDEPVSSTWWVHLPPFSTEREARIVLTELQGKKIDSFYMRTGELAGGISLGVFSRKESAFLVQTDIEEKGYTASVKEVQRMAKRYRIAVEFQGSVVMQASEFQDLLRKYDLGEVHELPCR